MERNINLAAYLPPFMVEYNQIREALAAENPEFKLLWQACGRVLQNEFISTADEFGISQYEKLLGMWSKPSEFLALRRARVQADWNRQPPYTLSWLRNWLDSICDPKAHLETMKDYTLTIRLDYDMLAEPNNLLREIAQGLFPMLPANILLQIMLTATSRFAVLQANNMQLAFLRIPFSIANSNKSITRLNGVKKLDGRWNLDQAIHTFVLRQMISKFAIAEAGVGISISSVLMPVMRCQTPEITVLSRIISKTKITNFAKTSQEVINIKCCFRYQNSLSGKITQDIMWRLNSAEALNGRRKLNAGIKIMDL